MNLDSYFSSLQRSNKKIFDPIRKKWLVETKEEIVRQLMIQYLINELNYGTGRLAIEKSLIFGKERKRFDILLYDSQANPFILIECKSYDIEIKPSAMYQIARYNLILKAPYLCVTNGRTSICATIDFHSQKIETIQSLPLNFSSNNST